MIKSSIAVNKLLLKEAKRLTGLKTTQEVIDHALREFVQRRQFRMRVQDHPFFGMNRKAYKNKSVDQITDELRGGRYRRLWKSKPSTSDK